MIPKRRATRTSTGAAGFCVDRVLRLAPDVLWLEVSHRPTVLRSADGQERPVEELTRGRWLGFCGIGNPDGFRRTLEVVGTSLAGWREFPDHCPYAAADLVALGRWAESHPDATAAICTGKDLVKISHDRLGRLPLWALMIELAIEAGEAQLIGRLRDLIGEPGIRRAGEVSPRISESNDDSTKSAG